MVAIFCMNPVKVHLLFMRVLLKKVFAEFLQLHNISTQFRLSFY